MLKKSITFSDLDGNSITEDFYFNLSKAELVELEVGAKDGLAETLKRLVEEEDRQQIVEQFKRIILLAYGVRSEDGRRFIKSEALRNEFAQTDAYSELFVELATKADSASEFINGIIPAGLKPPTEADDDQPKQINREDILKAFQAKNQAPRE